MLDKLYDFHTHTLLSDGVLSPIELIRRASINNYRAVALTEHASPAEMGRIIQETIAVCALARSHWDILAIPGIELVEMPRKREEAWCCGAGGGALRGFPEWAIETAVKRLEEAVPPVPRRWSCPPALTAASISARPYDAIRLILSY